MVSGRVDACEGGFLKLRRACGFWMLFVSRLKVSLASKVVICNLAIRAQMYHHYLSLPMILHP